MELYHDSKMHKLGPSQHPETTQISAGFFKRLLYLQIKPLKLLENIEAEKFFRKPVNVYCLQANIQQMWSYQVEAIIKR